MSTQSPKSASTEAAPQTAPEPAPDAAPDPAPDPAPSRTPDPAPDPSGGEPSQRARVLGLLMIVFASIGLLFSLGGLLGGVDFEWLLLLGGRTPRLESFEQLAGLAGLATGALHLTAGIHVVSQRRSASALTVIYGVSTLLRVGALLAVYWLSVAPLLAPFAKTQALGGYGFGFTVAQLVPLLWAVLLVALLPRRRRG